MPGRVHLHRRRRLSSAGLTALAGFTGTVVVRPRRVVGSRTPTDPHRSVEEASRRDESRVPHHALIGADGPALDVPGATENLEGLFEPEGAGGERGPQLGRLGDRRHVSAQDPARPEGGFGVAHDVPGLGQIEHDPIETLLTDAA